MTAGRSSICCWLPKAHFLLVLATFTASASAGVPICLYPTCPEANQLSGKGGPCADGLPCTYAFDSSGCPNATVEDLPSCDASMPGDAIGSNISATTWFSFTPGGSNDGFCTISTCDSGNYDSVIAVYNISCPGDLDDNIACGDDTCGVASGMSTVTFPCCSCDTYYVAVGGVDGDSGAGTVSITSDQSGPPQACDCFVLPPLADVRFDINGTVKPCITDEDCKADETGPEPQTVCRDSTGDGVSDACYVAHSRFLSIRPSPTLVGSSIGYRISLETQSAGNVALGFAGPPGATVIGGPGGGPIDYARVVDEPHFMDWTTLPTQYLSIGDCEISPGHNYVIQTIFEGSDTNNESSYLWPIYLPTVKDWGDVTGGGNPGDPPNGATGTLTDVFAIIKAFQNTENEPKLWLEIHPSSGPNPQPNFVMSLADAFDGIQAFQQNPYSGPAPMDCP